MKKWLAILMTAGVLTLGGAALAEAPDATTTATPKTNTAQTETKRQKQPRQQSQSAQVQVLEINDQYARLIINGRECIAYFLDTATVAPTQETQPQEESQTEAQPQTKKQTTPQTKRQQNRTARPGKGK